MKAVAFVVVCWGLFAFGSGSQMRGASARELAGASGGSCDYCVSQNFCKINEPCAPLRNHPGYYTKRVGTGIIQKFCAGIPANKPGRQFCESVKEKDCLNGWTCTDPNCDETVAGNCGPNNTEGKTTDCDFKDSKPCTT